VDQRDGVVGEQRVGPACQGQVVGDVVGGLGEGEPVEVEPQGDALIEGGEVALFEGPSRWTRGACEAM
jgi:hypothetical protein